MATITKAITEVRDNENNPHFMCHICFTIIQNGRPYQGPTNQFPFTALIDSGATNSYLGQIFITEFGIRRQQDNALVEGIRTPEGNINAVIHEDIVIEIENGFGRITIPIRSTGRSPRLEGQGHSLLIGMDVIRQGLFNIDGPANEFSFSIPDELLIPIPRAL